MIEVIGLGIYILGVAAAFFAGHVASRATHKGCK